MGLTGSSKHAFILGHNNFNIFFFVLFSLRCNTDILLGKNCGLITLHVGSGMDSLSDIRGWEKSEVEAENKLVPDFHIAELGHLLPLAEEILAKKA